MSNSLVRHLLLIAFLTGCWACTSVTEFEETNRSVSMDPGVLTQELPNGFQYFLRSANGVHDSDRIEVRLLVKTGSLHERDDQLGYAHLLEHMAFRGTRSFSVEGIENLLDGVGLRWGADVNATTHYGATIYRFTLHQDDSELLPQLFSLQALPVAFWY